MTDPHPTAVEPVEIVLYQDVLCAWSWIADRRLTHLAEEMAGLVRLRRAPYPLRPEPGIPALQERRRLARAVRKAAREPDGEGLSPDIWIAGDPPLSSVPALAALEAARLQGPAPEQALREALREAALVRGVNVARNDVLIEMAERTGLHVGRFSTALPIAEREIADAHRSALEQGIDAVPAVVIGDEWLVAGPRPLEEYRAILRRFLSTRAGIPAEPTLH